MKKNFRRLFDPAKIDIDRSHLISSFNILTDVDFFSLQTPYLNLMMEHPPRFLTLH